jgi:hypothetical protein
MRRASDGMRENIEISAKDSLGYYDFKQHKSWFEEESSNFWMEERKLSYSGYRIQAKEMKII